MKEEQKTAEETTKKFIKIGDIEVKGCLRELV